MYDEFEAFVNKPTAGSYRRTRNLILSDPHFQPTPADLAKLNELYRKGRYRRLQDRITAMMPQWALCPRVHLLAATAAERLGDQEDAEVEWLLASACLEGMLATGNGTSRRPYLTTYCGDQYDVLEMTGRRAVSQTLTQRRGRHFDVIGCDDGSEVWFDVTSLFRHAPTRCEPLLGITNA